jgi:hypothetical protein
VIGRSRSRAWLLAILTVAATIAVGGIPGSTRLGQRPRQSSGAPALSGPSTARGSTISQSYDRAGDPALIANANVPGDKSRPQWRP